VWGASAHTLGPSLGDVQVAKNTQLPGPASPLYLTPFAVLAAQGPTAQPAAPGGGAHARGAQIRDGAGPGAAYQGGAAARAHALGKL